MKPLTLIVLAAGMGSRYGGIKQLERIGLHGESLIDYSIYNAIRAGFTKIVLVIRKSIEDQVRDFFKGKIPTHIEVVYVNQELHMLPEGISVPENREKPWGTGHALLVCKDVVSTPFVMINGDDYYSFEALKVAADFLCNTDETMPEYAVVGYELEKTLSPHGSVSRGVCKINEEEFLVCLEEHIKIIREENNTIVSKEVIVDDKGTQKDIIFTGKEPVSMNLFAFTPMFLKQLQSGFIDFLQENKTALKSEFFVPVYLGQLIANGEAQARLLPTHSEWFGITYKEDTPMVKDRIASLVKDKVYPSPLY